ncbi:hypothetical protein OPV22_026912 [Ensete ventricosum]|uniref:Uncharacterized protein n=1 Tax=Ensete ventricosum TaxID=4639 RepID=A0AAV8Q6D0_ENSVE|nr:hypothetical protein OPV22_026912 [Ensete ventricosum]
MRRTSSTFRSSIAELDGLMLILVIIGPEGVTVPGPADKLVFYQGLSTVWFCLNHGRFLQWPLLQLQCSLYVLLSCKPVIIHELALSYCNSSAMNKFFTSCRYRYQSYAVFIYAALSSSLLGLLWAAKWTHRIRREEDEIDRVLADGRRREGILEPPAPAAEEKRRRPSFLARTAEAEENQVPYEMQGC